MAEAKQIKLYVGEHSEIELSNDVFAIDATVTDMYLSVFSWAKFRSTKAAVKLHTQLNIKTGIPEFIYITTGKVHEVNVLDIMFFQWDGFYVLDRGYTDFERLYRIHTSGAFFVISAKDNLHFNRIKSDLKAIEIAKTIYCITTQKPKSNESFNLVLLLNEEQEFLAELFNF